MYSADLTWNDWSFLNSRGVNDLIAVLDRNYFSYKKFYAYTYGLTDGQILALPFMAGKAQADLDAIRNSFNVFLMFYQSYFGTNSVALPVYDYSAYQMKFEG